MIIIVLSKRTFQISVTFPPGIDINEYNIISNMPLEEAQTKENQVVSASFKVCSLCIVDLIRSFSIGTKLPTIQ